MDNINSTTNPDPANTTTNKNPDANNKDKPISFEEYKIMATQEDVKTLRSKMRPKWYENIPLFGSLVYLIRIYFFIMMIDRGPLRATIYKWHIIFSFLLLGIFYSLLMILTPWFFYFINKTAVAETEKRIKIGNV